MRGKFPRKVGICLAKILVPYNLYHDDHVYIQCAFRTDKFICSCIYDYIIYGIYVLLSFSYGNPMDVQKKCSTRRRCSIRSFTGGESGDQTVFICVYPTTSGRTSFMFVVVRSMRDHPIPSPMVFRIDTKKKTTPLRAPPMNPWWC